MKRRVLLVSSHPDSVVSFRGDLLRQLVAADCLVKALSGESNADVRQEIESLGVTFDSYSINRNAISVFKDLSTLSQLRRHIQSFRPDIIIAYTIKPVIWSGIATLTGSERFYALITGLGYTFQGDSWKRRLLSRFVTLLYRLALLRAEGVIFQNSDNREEFVERRIVSLEKCHVVSGSGINLKSFPFTPIPDGPAHFLLIARLLGEKGIREFVTAAETVKRQYPSARFAIVGPTDPSPDGIPLKEVSKWQERGIVEYRGATKDVRPHIAECHVYVLPSYHEGLPRSVLEAMAMGRPILTTDTCGCRETVRNGVNGWLVPKQDSDALAERMIWFVENREQWASMAEASRKLAEEVFDVEKVNRQMLSILSIPTVSCMKISG